MTGQTSGDRQTLWAPVMQAENAEQRAASAGRTARPAAVRVRTPSRLHFGMFSFGQPRMRQFGGAGAMLDRPGLELRITPAERFEVDGPSSPRVREFAEHVLRALNLRAAPRCRLTVVAAPPEHVGLGSGTQLGLAVAAALNAFLGRPRLEPRDLARLAGRGKRSAIGTYGFAAGGMLVEAGKLLEPHRCDDADLSPLIARAELPAGWRFVLVCPRGERGLSGDAERDAFSALPPVPLEVTAALCHEIAVHLLPAAGDGRFEEFSESLYRYGHQAGLCFAARQGGAYASPRLAARVETIRGLGVRGAGQTSWGPTLFALLADQAAAEAFVERLRGRLPDDQLDLSIAAPDNRGARIEVEASGEESR